MKAAEMDTSPSNWFDLASPASVAESTSSPPLSPFWCEDEQRLDGLSPQPTPEYGCETQNHSCEPISWTGSQKLLYCGALVHLSCPEAEHDLTDPLHSALQQIEELSTLIGSQKISNCGAIVDLPWPEEEQPLIDPLHPALQQISESPTSAAESPLTDPLRSALQQMDTLIGSQKLLSSGAIVNVSWPEVEQPLNDSLRPALQQIDELSICEASEVLRSVSCSQAKRIQLPVPVVKHTQGTLKHGKQTCEQALPTPIPKIDVTEILNASAQASKDCLPTVPQSTKLECEVNYVDVPVVVSQRPPLSTKQGEAEVGECSATEALSFSSRSTASNVSTRSNCSHSSSGSSTPTAQAFMVTSNCIPATYETYMWLNNVVAPMWMRHPEQLATAYHYFSEANALHSRMCGMPSAETLYNMACCLSLGAGACLSSTLHCVGVDPAPGLPCGTASRASIQELADARLDLSFVMLEQAVDAGFADMTIMLKDTDISTVREVRPLQFASLANRVVAKLSAAVATSSPDRMIRRVSVTTLPARSQATPVRNARVIGISPECDLICSHSRMPLHMSSPDLRCFGNSYKCHNGPAFAVATAS